MNNKTISSKMAAPPQTSAPRELPAASPDPKPKERSTAEPWVTKKYVAQHYGVCARTIERAMDQFDLPHEHFLNRVMFQISAIDAWLPSNQKFRFARARHTSVSKSASKPVQVTVPNGLEIVPSVNPPPASQSNPPIEAPKQRRKSGQSRRANNPNPKPERRCPDHKHSFGPGLHTRTCSRCGFTQIKDPSGAWIAWT